MKETFITVPALVDTRCDVDIEIDDIAQAVADRFHVCEYLDIVGADLEEVQDWLEGEIKGGDYHLKPCPFCFATQPVVKLHTNDDTERSWVQCDGCGSSGPREKGRPMTAVSLWNKRGCS